MSDQDNPDTPVIEFGDDDPDDAVDAGDEVADEEDTVDTETEDGE